MAVESQADRLAMLSDWDSVLVGGEAVPCVYDEPFAEDGGALGQAPELETDRAAWLAAGGATGVTVTVTSSTAGAVGDFVVREVRTLEDGAMIRARLERA